MALDRLQTSAVHYLLGCSTFYDTYTNRKLYYLEFSAFIFSSMPQ